MHNIFDIDVKQTLVCSVKNYLYPNGKMKKKPIKKIKVFIRDKVFRVRTFLIIIFLATILFLSTHQRYLYEKGEYFITKYTEIASAK